MAAVYAANARRDISDKAPVVHHAQQSMSQPQTPQPQVRVASGSTINVPTPNTTTTGFKQECIPVGCVPLLLQSNTP